MKPIQPTEAIAWARRQKVLLPSDFYGKLRGRARAGAFTISGLSILDQIERVRRTLNDVLESGGTLAAWKRRVRQGDIALDLPAHRIENIFRTNIQSWYAAGRCRAIQDTKPIRPYLMYSAVNDSRTRPSHAAMHGHIAHIDDPIWKRWMPPAGFQCRCTVIALSEKQAMERGIKPAPPVSPDQGWDYSVCEDGPEEGLARARRSKPDTPIKAALEDAGKIDVKSPTYLFGEQATLPEIKQLGGQRLDDLLADVLPDDPALVPAITDRGRVIGDAIEAGDARFVVPAIREVLRRRLAEHRSFGVVKPEIYQRSGKGRAAILRAASRYPDDWVDHANRNGGPLHVVYSDRRRGYFVEREWIRAKREFRRVIRTSSLSTAEHEFAHHLQHADPALDRLFVEEHRRRTAGEPRVQVTPGRRSEIGREDRYVTPYQGREYGNDEIPYEVMAIAFEAVLGEGKRADEWFAWMLQNDREMLQLVLGALFHYSPRVKP